MEYLLKPLLKPLLQITKVVAEFFLNIFPNLVILKTTATRCSPSLKIWIVKMYLFGAKFVLKEGIWKHIARKGQGKKGRIIIS
jgi:hypothetical protein